MYERRMSRLYFLGLASAFTLRQAETPHSAAWQNRLLPTFAKINIQSR
ncbi:MAG: hypothetical protein KME26_08645 [Oscillatoria princeps RMCB-10]|nr:hypothetical protein [Oscillatoria princeps RMCB-10]